MNPLKSLRRLWANSDRIAVLLTEIRDLTAVTVSQIEAQPAGPVKDQPVVDISVLPVSRIPHAPIDFEAHDPLLPLKSSPAFEACADYFRNSPAKNRALVSPETQALLYSPVRTLGPGNVIENRSVKRRGALLLLRGAAGDI